MGYIAVGYLFGIVLSVIGYYIFKKYKGNISAALAAVFGLIGVLVTIYSIIITIVMIADRRSY